MTIRISITAFVWLLLLAVAVVTVTLAQEEETVVPDIVELQPEDPKLGQLQPVEYSDNSYEIFLDASRLGTGRDFYSRSSIVLQVGGTTKSYKRKLGNAENNNHFVGESESGDYLQLLRYISNITDNEILIGSVTELDSGMVYQVRSDPYNPEEQQEVVLRAKVRHSTDFPPSGDPPEMDDETIASANELYQQSILQANALFPDEDSAAAPDITSTATPFSYKDKTDIISFMVIWSERSECAYSFFPPHCIVNDVTQDRIRALIDFSVAETNIVYILSEIDVQLELVHAYRHPTYDEEEFDFEDALPNGVFENTLRKMSIPRLFDGLLDDIPYKRKKYNADMVSFLIDDDKWCGLATIGAHRLSTVIKPIPVMLPLMNSVVAYDCAFGNYVMAHELGHNMGCQHDRGTLDQCSAFYAYYAHGWRDPGCSFRTVMAYQCEPNQCDDSQCDFCNRIPYFSRGDADFLGVPLGNHFNDCARHIRITAPKIARFHDDDYKDNCDPEDTSCQVGGVLCFAPDMTTIVEGQGRVAMKDLQVGDRVLTIDENNLAKYEPIYSMNHYNKHQPTPFLQIHTTDELDEPLELSAHHMLFVQGKVYPIPASEVKVGQVLQSLQTVTSTYNKTELSGEHRLTQVTNITTVWRDGYYNLHTSSGKVVVNSVIASTYASLPLNTNSVQSAFALKDGHIYYGSRAIISYQRFVHALLLPNRVISQIQLSLSGSVGVATATRKDDRDATISESTRIGLRLFDWWQRQNNMVQTTIFSLVLGLVGILEIATFVFVAVCNNPQSAVVAFLVPLVVARRLRKKPCKIQVQ